jgi:hypothetical protein
VSGTGKIVLGDFDFSTKVGLLNISNVESEATTISTTFTVPANTTLTLKAAAEPADDVTVAANGVINVEGSLTIAADKILANAGMVNLVDSGSLILTGGKVAEGSGNGAKLTGVGKVIAGDTEIIGGTNGWQAVNTSDTESVTITVNTITGTAKVVLTAGATGGAVAPSITVTKSGTLVVAADTAINVTASGSIVLTAATSTSSNDGGTINLSATTAKITGLKGGAAATPILASGDIGNASYTVGTNGATGDKVMGSGTQSAAGTAWIGACNDIGDHTIQANTDSNAIIDKDTTLNGS